MVQQFRVVILLHRLFLPLRGKILNTERASLDRMMKSDTIESLITAIGGGYGEEIRH